MKFLIYLSLILSGPCTSKQNKKEEEASRILGYKRLVDGWISMSIDCASDTLNHKLLQNDNHEITEAMIEFRAALKILKGELSLYNPKIFPSAELLRNNITETRLIDLFKKLEVFKNQLARAETLLTNFVKFDVNLLNKGIDAELQNLILKVNYYVDSCMSEIDILKNLISILINRMKVRLNITEENYRKVVAF